MDAKWLYRISRNWRLLVASAQDTINDWQRDALKVILVVQEKDSGRVIGVAARQLSTAAS